MVVWGAGKTHKMQAPEFNVENVERQCDAPVIHVTMNDIQKHILPRMSTGHSLL